VGRADYPHFEHKLRTRWLELRARTRDVLMRSDNERYAQIAGQVHDMEEESLADLLVDLNLGELDRDVREIRDIEAALQRLSLGTYGICVTDGEPIERDRLEAQPTARRCALHQREYEHEHASAPTPTL
jgi:RNA polymerase-binding transcription factor DksA